MLPLPIRIELSDYRLAGILSLAPILRALGVDSGICPLEVVNRHPVIQGNPPKSLATFDNMRFRDPADDEGGVTRSLGRGTIRADQKSLFSGFCLGNRITHTPPEVQVGYRVNVDHQQSESRGAPEVGMSKLLRRRSSHSGNEIRRSHVLTATRGNIDDPTRLVFGDTLVRLNQSRGLHAKLGCDRFESVSLTHGVRIKTGNSGRFHVFLESGLGRLQIRTFAPFIMNPNSGNCGNMEEENNDESASGTPTPGTSPKSSGTAVVEARCLRFLVARVAACNMRKPDFGRVLLVWMVLGVFMVGEC